VPYAGGSQTFEYPKSQILSRGAGFPSISVFSNFRSLERGWLTLVSCLELMLSRILFDDSRPLTSRSRFRCWYYEGFKENSPMTYTRTVAVPHSRDELLKKIASLILNKATGLDNTCKQLPCRCKFEWLRLMLYHVRLGSNDRVVQVMMEWSFWCIDEVLSTRIWIINSS